jgi:hypothetical protein
MKRGTAGLIWLGVVGTGIAAFVGASEYIDHRAISEAAAHGVTLSIGQTHWLSDGIHFESVAATTVQIPNAHIVINDLTVNWSFSEVVANGCDVTIDGPVTAPNLVGKENPVPAPSGPSAIHVQSAHILWTHAFGDTTLEFTNATGDLPLAPTFRNAGVTWTTDVAVTVRGQKFGPFSAEFEHGQEENLTVHLDPADRDAATIRVSMIGSPSSHVEVNIAGRPLSKLGIPTSAFGFQLASDPKISLRLNDEVDRPTGAAPHANGSVDFGTDPIALPGLPEPAPVALSMNWSGNADQPIPLNADPRVTGSSLTIGPFHGPITGSISRRDNALVLDLAFNSLPVPCSKFSPGDPLKNLLGNSAFGAMAAMAGATSTVTGDVKLSGSVQFDSRNPQARKVLFTPVTTCGASISLGSGEK